MIILSNWLEARTGQTNGPSLKPAICNRLPNLAAGALTATKLTVAEIVVARSIRSFIDTNVLVYAEASVEAAKRHAALKLLKRLYEDGSGVISTQVLHEFCSVSLKKLKLSAQHVRVQPDF